MEEAGPMPAAAAGAGPGPGAAPGAAAAPLPCVTHTSREWAAPRGFSHAKTCRYRRQKGARGKISKFNFNKFECAVA